LRGPPAGAIVGAVSRPQVRRSVLATLVAGILAACLCWGAAGAQAATGCWSGPSGGNWSNPSNWREGIIPGPGDTAILNGITNGCNMATTVVVDTDVSVGILSSPFTKVEVQAGKTLAVTGDAGPSESGTSTVSLGANAKLHVPENAVFRPSGAIEMEPGAEFDVEGTVHPFNLFTTIGGTANFSGTSKVLLDSETMLLGNPNTGRTKINLQGKVDMSGGYKGGAAFLYPTADSPSSGAEWSGPSDSEIVGKMVNQESFAMSGPIEVGGVELTDGTLHLTGNAPCALAKMTLFSPAVINLDAGRTCNVSGKLDMRAESRFGGRSGAGTLTAGSADLTNGRFDGGGLTRITGATTIGGSGPTVIRGGATLRTEGATAWQWGIVELGAAGEGGTWENAGTLTIDSSRVGSEGVALGLRDGGGTGVLRNLAGATIARQAPVGEFTVAGHLENAGTIDVRAGSIGKPGDAGTIAQSGGTTHVAAGATLDLPLSMSGGSLSGAGTVRGVTNSGGTVAPGDPTGTLTVSGDYTQGAGGTFEARLAGAAAGAYGQLAVAGAAALAGAVKIVRAPEFSPALADTFKVLQSGSRGGEFASLAGDTTAPGGLVFGAVYGADGATLCFAGGGLCAGTPPPDPGTQPPATTPVAPANPATPLGPAPGKPSGPGTSPETSRTVSLAGIASLPSAKACISRHAFKFSLRLPKGMKVASAEISAGGKRVTVKGKALAGQITLKNVPQGTFVLQITLVATDGTKVTGKQTYPACGSKKKSPKKKHSKA